MMKFIHSYCVFIWNLLCAHDFYSIKKKNKIPGLIDFIFTEEDDDNDAPVAKITTSKVVQAKATQPRKGASIAAKTDRFTIQITSKRMLNDAQLFSQKMISKGYDAYIQKAVFDTDEIWYRVRVGSYDNYNSAKASADALSGELGMATWVDFVRKER